MHWKFINDNIDFFKSNPRLFIMTKMLEKIPVERKNTLFNKGENFIAKNTF